MKSMMSISRDYTNELDLYFNSNNNAEDIVVRQHLYGNHHQFDIEDHHYPFDILEDIVDPTWNDAWNGGEQNELPTGHAEAASLDWNDEQDNNNNVRRGRMRRLMRRVPSWWRRSRRSFANR
mmetsp:Transcript_3159/g.6971  ORF Transcript_3159/g.6971 Transcript_3159/m.6971 type:complete len:122 (-) Transcript_3159:96-461(-)